MELLNYVQTINNTLQEKNYVFIKNSKEIQQQFYKNIVYLVSNNLFRSLTPRLENGNIPYDPEEDEANLVNNWDYISYIYELFLSFLELPDFNVEIAKNYIDTSFVNNLLNLFDNEDDRERDYLKTTLHRIYKNFIGLRFHIRNGIKHIFLQVIYENKNHNGIKELLEFLCSIISGFGVPLKEEHKIFFIKILLPLYKQKILKNYHENLFNCILEFLKKDSSLIENVMNAILKFWPKSDSNQILLFIEQIKKLSQYQYFFLKFDIIAIPLFKKLLECFSSPHFLIVQKSLHLFNNPSFELATLKNRKILLLVCDSLYNNAKYFWHKPTADISFIILNRIIYNILHNNTYYQNHNHQYNNNPNSSIIYYNNLHIEDNNNNLIIK